MQKVTEVIASNVVIQAVLSILFGLLLAIWPETTTVTLVYILAACVALSGAASVVAYIRGRKEGTVGQGTLVSGLLLVIVAIVVFVVPEAVAGLFAVVLGALLILSGLINVVRSFGLRYFGGALWVVMLIVSASILIGGIVIIVNPFDTAVTFILVVGILLVVKGIADLVIFFADRRSGKPQGSYRR